MVDPHSSSGNNDEAESGRFNHNPNPYDILQTKDAHQYRCDTREQKSMNQND